MNEKKVIYFKEIEIVITANLDNIPQSTWTMQIQFQSELQIKELISYLTDRPIHERIVLLADEVDWCFDAFLNHFKLIKAGGGLVLNQENHLLMILRNGKWDLPKGKLEPNENIEEAAIREVEEECGVKGLKITDAAIYTYHIYWMQNKPFLKKTYWYKMTTDYDSVLVPQVEEGIEEVVWANHEQVSQKLKNTYANIRHLLTPFLQEVRR